MTTDHIAWDAAPPPDDGSYIEIAPAPCFGCTLLVCISTSVVGVWTHYIDGRTVPCTLPSGSCRCRPEKLAKRWRGYLATWQPREDKRYLVELTADAYRHTNVDLADMTLELRGLLINLSRAGRSKRSPVRVNFTTATYALPDLPPEPDVRAALERIWSGHGKGGNV